MTGHAFCANGDLTERTRSQFAPVRRVKWVLHYRSGDSFPAPGWWTPTLSRGPGYKKCSLALQLEQGRSVGRETTCGRRRKTDDALRAPPVALILTLPAALFVTFARDVSTTSSSQSR